MLAPSQSILSIRSLTLLVRLLLACYSIENENEYSLDVDWAGHCDLAARSVVFETVRQMYKTFLAVNQVALACSREM